MTNYRTTERQVLQIIIDKYKTALSLDTFTNKLYYNGEVLDIAYFNHKYILKQEDLNISDEALYRLLVNETDSKFSSLQYNLDQYYLKYGSNDSIEYLCNNILFCKTKLEKEYITKFLISAVARAFVPGCKVDTALVLYSKKQGLYKTTFFETLASTKYFNTIQAGLNDTELRKLCSHYWILEYGEFDRALNYKSISIIKNFMSTKIDTWREFHKTNYYVESPRTFVICGTTNSNQLLVDNSDERRFWVMEIDKKIDINWVANNREQLWSQAVHLFKEGYIWWLTDEEQETSNELNKNYKTYDLDEEKITNYVEAKKETNTVFTSDQLITELQLKISSKKLFNILTNKLNLTSPLKTSVNGVKGKFWLL